MVRVNEKSGKQGGEEQQKKTQQAQRGGGRPSRCVFLAPIEKQRKKNVANDDIFRSVADHDAALQPARNCVQARKHVSFFARSKGTGQKSERKRRRDAVNAAR